MGYRSDHKKANEEILGFDHPMIQKCFIDSTIALNRWGPRHQTAGHSQQAKDYIWSLFGENGEDEFDLHCIIDDLEIPEEEKRFLKCIKTEGLTQLKERDFWNK